jgi:hypothetical protein
VLLLLDGPTLFLTLLLAIFSKVTLPSTSKAFILSRVHFPQEHPFLLWGDVEGGIGSTPHIHDPVFLHGPLGPVVLVEAGGALGDHFYCHWSVESRPV